MRRRAGTLAPCRHRPDARGKPPQPHAGRTCDHHTSRGMRCGNRGPWRHPRDGAELLSTCCPRPGGQGARRGKRNRILAASPSVAGSPLIGGPRAATRVCVSTRYLHKAEGAHAVSPQNQQRGNIVRAFLVMGLAIVAITGNAMLVSPASAQTTFVNPTANGGYIISRPGGPTTFVNPTANGGYIANTPGVGTTFANPTPNGGYIVSRPGSGGMYSPIGRAAHQRPPPARPRPLRGARAPALATISQGFG
jgi:hypothetical protein